MSVRSVLVAGANRGLGLALCRALLRLGGYRVLAAARAGGWSPAAGGARDELAAAAAAAARTPSRWGGGVAFLELDVACARSRAALAGPLAAALGASRLHALVLCAGADGGRDGAAGPGGGWSEAALRRALAVNAAGPLRLAAELAPFYVPATAGGGAAAAAAPPPAHVLCLASGLARRARVLAPGGAYARALAAGAAADDIEALPFDAADAVLAAPGFDRPAYSLAKAALAAGARALAAGPLRGLARVNAVDPGWCSTDMCVAARAAARNCARARARARARTRPPCQPRACSPTPSLPRRGGPAAPRTPADGARNIYAALVADPALTGTGNLINRDGKVVEWL